MRGARCYICGKELAFAENTSIRFYETKLRKVRSKGFHHLETKKDGSVKAVWNEPYETEEYAQTAIGSFCVCKDCGKAIYQAIKNKEIQNG